MKLLKELIERLLRKFKLLKKDKEESENNEKSAVVLDTSALQSKKGMQIIEMAGRVILLTGTIRELDKYKKAEGIFGTNIRIVSRKSREDINEKKYICVDGYEESKYQDNNILKYCKDNPSAVILTGDNNLCNLAKAYGITYIYVEPEIETTQTETIKESEENKAAEKKQYIKGAFLKDGNLYIHKTNWMIYNFVYRNSELVREKDPFIKLQKEDIVFQIRIQIHDEQKFIKVLKYEIESIDENGYAKYLTHTNIYLYAEILINEIKEKLPNEVLGKVLRIYSTLNVHNSTYRVNLMDTVILREGETIEKKYEYRQADKVYKISRVKSSKHIFVREYEIILNGDIYELVELDKYNIYYLNDIFRYHFPEPLEEAVRKEYLEAFNY